MKGYIRRREANSYRITINTEKGSDGEHKYYHECVSGGRREAEARLTELLSLWEQKQTKTD